jgi:hypothetical protein
MIDPTADDSRSAIPANHRALRQGTLLAHHQRAQRNIMRERPLIAAEPSLACSGGKAPYDQRTGEIK